MADVRVYSFSSFFVQSLFESVPPITNWDLCVFIRCLKEDRNLTKMERFLFAVTVEELASIYIGHIAWYKLINIYQQLVFSL